MKAGETISDVQIVCLGDLSSAPMPMISRERSSHFPMQTDPDQPKQSQGVERAVLLKRLVSLTGPMTRERVIFVMGRMLFLAAEDPNEPLLLEINSTGGNTHHAMDILRIMDRIDCRVATFCRGEARGAALVIAAHGAPGFRAAVPECRFSLWLRSARENAEKLSESMREVLLKDIGAHRSQLLRCLEKSADFDSLKALQNGLIDVISPKPLYPGLASSRKANASARS